MPLLRGINSPNSKFNPYVLQPPRRQQDDERKRTTCMEREPTDMVTCTDASDAHGHAALGRPLAYPPLHQVRVTDAGGQTGVGGWEKT